MRASQTNAKIAGWDRRYRTALRRYLSQGPASSLKPALGLGRQAATLGLETLDVARIHEQALAAMESPGASRSRTRAVGRSQRFFAETIHPIEQTHAAAQESALHLHQLDQTLHRRTVESSAASRRLRRTILQRRGAEEALRMSGKQHATLLAEAHRLQTQLRHLTREFLLSHEDKRRKMSCQLHDEIAQTLLGIHVRLLALKKSASAHSVSLKKEIASTQRLVKESVKMIDRAADEYGIHHET